MRDINSIRWENALAQNRVNSLPSTCNTSTQGSGNQMIGVCLQSLGSRAFSYAKRTDLRLFSTVSLGIIQFKLKLNHSIMYN